MDTIGFLAAVCVLASFSMQSMIALRALAIASNVLFIAYSIEARLPPIFFLHAILLPINCWSLARLAHGNGVAAAFGAFSFGLALCVIIIRFDGAALAWFDYARQSQRVTRR